MKTSLMFIAKLYPFLPRLLKRSLISLWSYFSSSLSFGLFCYKVGVCDLKFLAS